MPPKLKRKPLKEVMKTKPLQFQFEGIKRIWELEGRAILADEMGLGKTLQALGFLAMCPSALPAIIVCPSTAKYVWLEQMKEHCKGLHSKTEVLSGEQPYPASKSILIINYDIIIYWQAVLSALRPNTIIMDECHYIKSLGSRKKPVKRTKACQAIAKRCKHIIPISGTPIELRPIEFFPILNILQPRRYRGVIKYGMRYCDGKAGHRGRGWDFSGASNIKELHENVKPIMIRRKKKDVAKHLPPKQIIPIQINLDNMKTYKKARDDFLKYYREYKGAKQAKKIKKAQALVRLTKLRELTGIGKIKSAIEWINDFLESENKLVVFCRHKIIHNKLCEKYSKISVLGGSGNSKQKKIQETEFQTNPKKKLYLGTIGADRECITLTKATSSLFIELGWNPMQLRQAEDRIHRLTTTEPVSIYYLLGRQSVDMSMWEDLREKAGVVDSILDGKKRKQFIRLSFDNIGNKIERSLIDEN